MARKTTTAKDTRAAKYGAILAQQGVTLAECIVLGYKFPDNAHAARFHFDLMGAHIPKLLFDGVNDTAIVIIKKDFWNPETPGIIDILAEQAGGKEYKPNLNQ